MWHCRYRCLRRSKTWDQEEEAETAHPKKSAVYLGKVVVVKCPPWLRVSVS
jgi:hypothetical protein